MGFFSDLFRALTAPVGKTAYRGLDGLNHPETDDVHGPVSSLTIPDPSVRETLELKPGSLYSPGPTDPRPTCVTHLPQRYGTFLLVDLYPGSFKGRPDWQALEATSKWGNFETIGAILKATEGSKYRYDYWLPRELPKLREAYGDRLRRDRFVGCYHFLQLAGNGRGQAEYFVKTVEKAGGLAKGDIMPMLDFEQGGQVRFFPTDCPKDKDGRYMLHLLPDSVKRDLVRRAMETTRACADRIHELTGWDCLLYGRGLQRDLGMRLDRGYTSNELRMGCAGNVNPAYTKELPTMDPYGWPLELVKIWQYSDGTKSAHPGLPTYQPGFGRCDMNVVLDGPRRVSLSSFREDCLL